MLRQVQGGIWGLPQVHHHHSQAAGRPSTLPEDRTQNTNYIGGSWQLDNCAWAAT